MNNNVSLEYIDNYNIDKVQQIVENSFSKLGVEDLLKNKKTVLLKVCASSAVSPDLAETTHPSVIRAIVNVLTKYGVKCLVADSPYGNFSTSWLDNVYLNTGILEVANQTNCELNRDLRTCEITQPNGVMAKSLTMLEIVKDVDAIINISKLKIDGKLGYVGAVANLFGLIPGDVKNLVLNRLKTLKDFYNYNLDLYQTIESKVVLNVIDGIVAMEANNTQRLLSCLGVSENAFSLDASILDILNVNYSKTILKYAKERDLFDYDKPYKQLSEKIEKFKIQDFALTDFSDNSLLHKSESERKRYFKSTQQRVNIVGKKCKGCGVCTKICPTKALTMKYDKNGELYTVVDYDRCIFCYKCLTACPYKVVDVIQPSNYRKLKKELEKQNTQ